MIFEGFLKQKSNSKCANTVQMTVSKVFVFGSNQ